LPIPSNEALWADLPGAEDVHVLSDWGREHVPPFMRVRLRFWPQRAPRPGWRWAAWVIGGEPALERRLKVVKYDDPVWVPWWHPTGGGLAAGGPLPWQVEVFFNDFDYEHFWILPLEIENVIPPAEKRVCGPHVRVPEIPLGWDPFAY